MAASRDSVVAHDPLIDSVEAVIEALPTGLVIFDPHMRIVLRNHAAQALLPGEDLITTGLGRLTVHNTSDDWQIELKKVLEQRRVSRHAAMLGRREGQGDFYLNIQLSPLRNATGQVIGGVALLDDVSAHITMEQRLAVSERHAAIGKLSARVAHELNNPLDGILRYTNLALRRAGDTGDPKLVEYMEKARSGLQRMTQIVSALLEFSRNTNISFEQATINKIVEDAIAAMTGRAQDSRVTVVCNFHHQDMPVVRGSNLFQVFCNLLKNAIDAMPDGGTLTITTMIQGPDVVVTFEDTGIGLPEEMDRIFEPFFTTKPAGMGTGLGLAVCKEMIEKYSGVITAERRQPEGTRMTVRVPTRNCGAMPVQKPLGKIG